MNAPKAWRQHPVVYEINTRVWLAELSRTHGKRIHLGNVPDTEIERLRSYGLDGIWLMGVWAPSPTSRRISLRHSGHGSEFWRALPDLREEDVIGSPFAVFDYRVSDILGGDAGLRRCREQLSRFSLRLMLDFIPNHLAIDHRWVAAHPEFLVQCESPAPSPAIHAERMTQQDGCFGREVDGRKVRFAHGRDPYFPPWTDTVQVDYQSPAARAAMIDTLQAVADRCDGVRCDMAMLVTNDVFRRVWGWRRLDGPNGEFWEAAIAAVKARYPEFAFLAEVYWDMERALLVQGFDFTYDKQLYDQMVSGDAKGAHERLRLNGGFQARQARFIENHDEPRAIDALGRERSMVAAVLVATLPGLRLFHQGQFEGRRVRIPVQLGRRPLEEPDLGLSAFYRRLLRAASRDLFHDGEWRLVEPGEAWPGNESFRSIVAYTWERRNGEKALIVANLGEHQSQARIPLLWQGLATESWSMRELLDEDADHPTIYHRNGNALRSDGLFVELEPFSFHFLLVEPSGTSC